MFVRSLSTTLTPTTTTTITTAATTTTIITIAEISSKSPFQSRLHCF